MTSIIKLQPLSGAYGESPPCYMLQVDEFHFLLDCGWDEKFNMDHIKELKKHLHQIDAVLLSHPDVMHLGALPYMVGKCGLGCPIYATVPIYKMGQMFLYDLFQSQHNTHDFNLFTLDDIDAAFDKIIQLKYSQTVNLKGKGQGLQITPLPAGHMIGGTVWKIVKDGEEELVYAIDYNHKKERHLNGCVLETLSRPSVMITDAFNATYSQPRRKMRDEQLLTAIINTMRNDGNVLVAVDTAGRVLELAQLLDTMWKTPEAMLSAYSLALLNNVGFNVIEFAKSQVEWMSDKIMRTFEDNRNNPFQLKHLRLCHNLAELDKVPSPKVVLASVPDLESGFSRELFLQWCSEVKNCIILTSRSSPGTLARHLIDNPSLKLITTNVFQRIKLEGAELEEYNREKQETLDKLESVKLESTNDADSSDESDDEESRANSSFVLSAKGKHDLLMKNEAKMRRGFFKHTRKIFPMFPFHEEKIKWDEYGEITRLEDFMLKEQESVEEVKEMEVSEHEDEPTQDVTEAPTKCISKTINIEISATVTFIDFEGRSDGESMKRLIGQVKPRQLILVHGTEEATESLANHCRNTPGMIQGRILTPRLNEIVDATGDVHIYQVRLKDSLVSAMQFYKARDTELTWVDGQISYRSNKPDTSAVHETDAEMEGKNKETGDDVEDELMPTLESIPSHLVTGHTAVFINEPKLSDFKTILMKDGIQAEFIAGVLICNNIVAVRKNEAGRIQLEGAMCDEYFKIRDLLYSQYAIL